jgi:hypothetical protein
MNTIQVQYPSELQKAVRRNIAEMGIQHEVMFCLNCHATFNWYTAEARERWIVARHTADEDTDLLSQSNEAYEDLRRNDPEGWEKLKRESQLWDEVLGDGLDEADE